MTADIHNLNARSNTQYTQASQQARVISAQVQLVVVTHADDGQRLDNFLAKILKGAPRSHIQRIIRSGEVRVNGARAAFDARLTLGQSVRIPPIRLAAKTQASLTARQDIHVQGVLNVAGTNPHIKADQGMFTARSPFPIVFEDEHILAINKPSGIAVHGGSGVAFGVIEQLRQCGVTPFLELAHRIDRDTSGVLLMAKRRPALVKLQEQLRSSDWKKNYLCVVAGAPDFKQKDVALPLLRTETANGDRRVVVDQALGQYALSRLRVLRRFSLKQDSPTGIDAKFTELQVRILTGRTHQIRVHCASLGLPLLGDEKYGVFELNKTLKKHGLKRLMLHAVRLELSHPITGLALVFEASPPSDYTQFFACCQAINA